MRKLNLNFSVPSIEKGKKVWAVRNGKAYATTVNKAESATNGTIKPSTRKGKKAMVYMDGKWYHFGDDSMGHNYSEGARESATARHKKNLEGDDPRARAFRVYWRKYWKKGGSKKSPPSDQKIKKAFEVLGTLQKGNAKVEKVMEEFKSGKLKSSSGQKVTDRKQAIAIALSEAGLSKGTPEYENEYTRYNQ